VIARSEQLLIDELADTATASLLCTSAGTGHFARTFAARHPDTQVSCHFLDLFLAQQAAQQAAGLSNVHIACTSDLPAGDFETAVLPVSMTGNAELTRELLQQMHERLVIGGYLYAATDNVRDTWLAAELTKLFIKVDRRPREDGVVYCCQKREPLKKLKGFTAEFAFRDGPRLLKIITRPGVFGHRQIDAGARALLETMHVAPGERVFDIGCGSGALSLAAATRAEGVRVFAVDTNPRAIECTLRSAQLNGVDNVRASVNAAADCDHPGEYDVCLANPPYYSHFRIAEIFVAGAQRALRRGGRLHVVTKQPAWFEERLAVEFTQVSVQLRRGYSVFTAYQRAS
jgi:16S rRNA (guanine1207-N2)-methyltransferase